MADFPTCFARERIFVSVRVLLCTQVPSEKVSIIKGMNLLPGSKFIPFRVDFV